MYGYSKDCLILILVRLPQISRFTLRLKCFSSDSDNCPNVGMDCCFSSPTHQDQVQSYWHSCFSHSSFVLQSFAWLYILFSTGHVLLSTLSWCSACTSLYEGVFWMYPWREIYSTSIYSSAILSPWTHFYKHTELANQPTKQKTKTLLIVGILTI